jgi:hypothetical protein
LAWNPDKPLDGLGYRRIEIDGAGPDYQIRERPVTKG